MFNDDLPRPSSWTVRFRHWFEMTEKSALQTNSKEKEEKRLN